MGRTAKKFRSLLALFPFRRREDADKEPPPSPDIDLEDRERFLRYLDTMFNSYREIGMQIVRLMVKADSLPGNVPDNSYIQEQMQKNLRSILRAMDYARVSIFSRENIGPLMLECLESDRELLVKADWTKKNR